ncbi:tetratricopeptide repeat protein, partial [Chroococcidiopsis cubana]
EPQDARVYLQIGDLLKQQNDLNGALAAYRQALSIKPNLPVAQKAIREILMTLPASNRGTEPQL